MIKRQRIELANFKVNIGFCLKNMSSRYICKSVDGYVFAKLSKHIDVAISRASGNNEPVCEELQ